MLTVFGDESYDEKKQKIYAVSGVAGIQQEWDELEPKWIERTGGVTFHASDCESDRGYYKDNIHEENLKLYADMVRIIAKSSLTGFAVTMDLAAYREFFPDLVENMPYFFCFSLCSAIFFRTGTALYPPGKKSTIHI